MPREKVLFRHSSGNRKGTGNLPMEKPAKIKLRIASESEKVFARIFDECLGVQVSRKQAVFSWTIRLL